MSSTAIAGTGTQHPTQAFMRAPNYINANSVLASSANTLTIPTGAQYVRLAGFSPFLVRWGDTLATTVATTNGGSAGTGVASEYVLTDMYRNIGSTLGTTSISVISTAANVITQSWWTAN